MFKKLGLLLGFLLISQSIFAAESTSTVKTQIKEEPSQSKIVTEESATLLSQGTTRLKLYKITYGLTDSLEVETNFWKNSLKLLNLKTSYQLFNNPYMALKSAVDANYLLETKLQKPVLFFAPSITASFFSHKTIQQHFYIGYLPYVVYSGLAYNEESDSDTLMSIAIPSTAWEMESNTEFQLIKTNNYKTSLFITLGTLIFDAFHNEDLRDYRIKDFYKASFTIQNSWTNFQLGLGAGWSSFLALTHKYGLKGFYPVIDLAWTF
ncbi:MAG: hypothetical protein HYW47_04820 [Deltaproteobacteria bacterium]|nr:hypothetical protein [Deltaproteobacteria bacterium]